jgi:ribokinase
MMFESVKGTAPSFNVTGLGAISVDFMGLVDGWPESGAKKALSAISVQGGGLVATALVAVSRLGGRARFLGKLGRSQFAEQALLGLETEQVDTSLVVRDMSSEPIVAFVLSNTEDGQRNVFFSMHNTAYPSVSEMSDRSWLRETRVLLLDSVSGPSSVDFAALAKEAGVIVVLDLERVTPWTERLLETADHAVVPLEFAQDYTGKSENIEEMLSILMRRQEQSIIITVGERGAFGLHQGLLFHQPSFPVQVVDTTGCGDVFHGAYALAISQDEEPVGAAAFAAAAAALSARKLGGRAGIPEISEVQQLLLRSNTDLNLGKGT